MDESVNLTQRILEAIAESETVPEPVTLTQRLLKKIGDRVGDIDGRVKVLEDNPVDPEQLEAIIEQYLDEHPELLTLKLYRDEDGDLCEEDE